MEMSLTCLFYCHAFTHAVPMKSSVWAVGFGCRIQTDHKVLRLWASDLTSLGLRFLGCKMRIIIVLASSVSCHDENELMHWKLKKLCINSSYAINEYSF